MAGPTLKERKTKQRQAQDAFEKLVNRHGLAHAKVAHYESELGSLRIACGMDADQNPVGLFKWFYPEIDQDGRGYHYACSNTYTKGDSLEAVHKDMLQRGQDFAQEMLSGRVSRH